MSTKQQVLIVDDEHSMRDFLQASLAARFTVFTASNVADALKILKAETIDAVTVTVE